MVDVAVEDRQAGMAAGNDQGDDLVQGGVPLHPDHLQSGNHDLPHEGISELKDTLDELPFLAGYEAPFLAFIDDVLDFTLQVFRLRDDPPREHLPKALEEAGVRTFGLFHGQPRICFRSWRRRRSTVLTSRGNSRPRSNTLISWRVMPNNSAA